MSFRSNFSKHNLYSSKHLYASWFSVFSSSTQLTGTRSSSSGLCSSFCKPGKASKFTVLTLNTELWYTYIYICRYIFFATRKRKITTHASYFSIVAVGATNVCVRVQRVMAPLLLSWLGVSALGKIPHDWQLHLQTAWSCTCEKCPAWLPTSVLYVAVGWRRGRLTGAYGRCWGHVQFNEGRPGHMCTGMLTMLSLFTLCLVARCMQLMQMCFFETCLCRLRKPRVLRKCPPKAQPPRRGTLCLVSLGCSNTICVCMLVSISSMFIKHKYKSHRRSFWLFTSRPAIQTRLVCGSRQFCWANQQ